MKKLILLRHAHRDTSKGRWRDNGLSEKGKRQAKKFTSYYLRKYPGTKPFILSSPSKRCVQTVCELAQKFRVSVIHSDELQEKGMTRKETQLEYIRRVRYFCKKLLRRRSKIIVVCSHGDWLPVALRFFGNEKDTLKKGDWVDFPISL